MLDAASTNPRRVPTRIVLTAIGLLTFALPLLCVTQGSRFGHRPTRRVDVLPRVVVIGIGNQILTNLRNEAARKEM